MATPTTLPATFVAGNVLTAAQMNNLRGGFRVLQVVQASLDVDFGSNSTSFVDVTGLSVSITPAEATNKILVMAALQHHQGSTTYGGRINIVRDSTNIAQSTGSSQSDQSSAPFMNGADERSGVSIHILDAPATTSALTYKVQIASNNAGGTFYINDPARGSFSTITAMEISA